MSMELCPMTRRTVWASPPDSAAQRLAARWRSEWITSSSRTLAASDGVQVFSDEDAWDVLEDIPNDSAAALLLIEHHWAVPLREAIARAGGFRISDGFISPLDLIEVGLVSPEEAEVLHALETGAQAE